MNVDTCGLSVWLMHIVKTYKIESIKTCEFTLEPNRISSIQVVQSDFYHIGIIMYHVWPAWNNYVVSNIVIPRSTVPLGAPAAVSTSDRAEHRSL